MPLIPFPTLMAEAERSGPSAGRGDRPVAPTRRPGTRGGPPRAQPRGSYAVGYFEPWNLESLLAILRGAEDARSPVMVGLSGIFLPPFLGGELRHFAAFAQAGRVACEHCRVPVSYLFNETPYWDWALASLEVGFNVTMYSNPADDPGTHLNRTAELVRRAAAVSVAVQSELGSLEANGSADPSAAPRAGTDPEAAADFVRRTEVDALGVMAGNRHLMTGRSSITFELDLELIQRLAEAVPVPLVLHGGSSAQDDQLREGIRRGIRQVNYGAALRRVFLQRVESSLAEDWQSRNPHVLLGTGHDDDLMRPGLEAVSRLVAEKCDLLGSSGKA